MISSFCSTSFFESIIQKKRSILFNAAAGDTKDLKKWGVQFIDNLQDINWELPIDNSKIMNEVKIKYGDLNELFK